MKSKFKRPLVVVCVILCVVAVVFVVKLLIPLSPQDRALRLYVESVPDNDDYPSSIHSKVADLLRGKYKYEIEPIGKNSWCVCRIRLGWAPEYAQDRFLIHDDKATSLTAEALLEIFKSDVPAALSDSQQMDVIKRFINMLYRYSFGVKIIGGTGEIKDYVKAPLSPKLAASIQPPRVQAARDGGKTHILYTHDSISGSVRRQEFTFDKSGKLIDVKYTEIGVGIGGIHPLI